MESQNDDLLKGFQSESQDLVRQMTDILNECEGDYGRVSLLEQYGNLVDRIMGGAKNLAVMMDLSNHIIHKIADYAAICKAVGYKTSLIQNNEPFYDICVALLLDATDVLESMVGHVVTNPTSDMKDLINQQLIDRLKWVSQKFGDQVRSSVAVEKNHEAKMSQADIDNLLKKLGLT